MDEHKPQSPKKPNKIRRIAIFLAIAIGLWILYDQFGPYFGGRFLVAGGGLVCTLDTSGLRTHCIADGANPRWSPDGKQIVFAKSDPDDSQITHISTMDANGQNVYQLVYDKFIEESSSMSGDGKKVAYVSWGIYVLDLNSGVSKQINDTNWPFTKVDWSRDSTRIVFTASPSRTTVTDTQIYVMNADGSDLIQLTTPPTHNDDPRWSPDSTKIVFSSNRDVTGGSGADIYVMNADGSNVVRLTDDPAVDMVPAWSPDGTQIAFLSNRDGRTEQVDGARLSLFQIFIMNADGSNERQVTFGLYTTYTDLDWGP